MGGAGTTRDIVKGIQNIYWKILKKEITCETHVCE